MSALTDYNIFSSIDPSAMEPKEKKPMPFPLENFDEEIASVYEKTSRILAKIQAAQQNPINNTPARKRRLKSLKYKIKTCLQLMQEVSISCSELWY